MKPSTIFISLVALLSLASGLRADDFAPPPIIEDFGGSIRVGYYRITLGGAEPYRLTKNEVVRAEEIVIGGTVYTEGNQLLIDTRRLIFLTNGKIVGFEKPAPNTTQEGKKGDPGATAGRKDRDGQTGGAGGAGDVGPVGSTGRKNPGPILIFAGDVVGTPIVQAIGQKGGMGGKGGKGGTGGQGGTGEDARASCWPPDSHSAGWGGDSGSAGPGGKGGPGGPGGDAIPLVFTTAKAAESINFSQVVSAKGEPGDGGLPGDRGDAGKAGTGGAGASESCMFGAWVDRRGQGGGGNVNNADPGNKGKGDLGIFGADVRADNSNLQPFKDPAQQANVITKTYSEVEGIRESTLRAWYQFHWARLFNQLVQKSILLASDAKASREELISSDGATNDAVLMQIVQEANHLAAEEISKNWNENFVKALQDLNATEKTLSHAGELSPLARPLIQATEKMKDLQPEAEPASVNEIVELFKSSLIQSESLLQARLDTAIAECSRYVQTYQKLVSQLSVTSNYLVPVCLGQPDMTQPQNLDAEIVTIRPLTAAAPAGVVPQLIGPNDAIQLSRNEFNLWRTVRTLFNIPAAFAEDFEIILVDNRPIPVDRVLEAAPAINPASLPTKGTAGMVLKYKMTPDSEIKRNTLGYQIRILSLLTRGAK